MSVALPPGTANRPEPGVAHVTVMLAVRTVSSWVRPIMPWMPMTVPGVAAASAARSPASSLTVTVAGVGQAAGAAAAKSGRPAVGTALWSWQAAASARNRGTAWVMRFMSGLLVRDVDVDDDVLIRPDAPKARRRHRDAHHAPDRIGRRVRGDAARMLAEPGIGHLGSTARAHLIAAVGLPVHGDQTGRAAERVEARIAARVGREVQLLRAAVQIPVRDQAAAAQEVAGVEAALFDEVPEERLRTVGGAAATDAQVPVGEPAPATGVVRKPVDVRRRAVGDEMGLVARPSPAARKRVGRGREARPGTVRLSRGRRRRVLACAEYGNECECGPPNKRANVHRDLLWYCYRVTEVAHVGSASHPGRS